MRHESLGGLIVAERSILRTLDGNLRDWRDKVGRDRANSWLLLSRHVSHDPVYITPVECVTGIKVELDNPAGFLFIRSIF